MLNIIFAAVILQMTILPADPSQAPMACFVDFCAGPNDPWCAQCICTPSPYDPGGCDTFNGGIGNDPKPPQKCREGWCEGCGRCWGSSQNYCSRCVCREFSYIFDNNEYDACMDQCLDSATCTIFP